MSCCRTRSARRSGNIATRSRPSRSISEEPFIPWELLYVVDPDVGPEGKGFLSEWGLVRWLHSTRSPGRQLALNKDRVRYVIPDYVDPGMQLKGAAEERTMLTRIVRQSAAGEGGEHVSRRFPAEGGEELRCAAFRLPRRGSAARRHARRPLMTGDKIDGNFVVDALDADVVKTHTRFAADGPRPIVFINACQTGRGGTGLTAGVAGFVDAFLRPMSEQGAGALDRRALVGGRQAGLQLCAGVLQVLAGQEDAGRCGARRPRGCQGPRKTSPGSPTPSTAVRLRAWHSQKHAPIVHRLAPLQTVHRSETSRRSALCMA